jgi:hypothetical protein
MPANGPRVVEDFASPGGLTRFGFFLAQDGEEPLAEKVPCFKNVVGRTSRSCPLHRVQVLRAMFKKPIRWVGNALKPLPQNDLALLELQPESLPLSARSAIWGKAPVDSGRKTLVATGVTTDSNRWVGFELQVGLIPGGQLSFGHDHPNRVYTWENKPDGWGTAVCPGDSGGAVFDHWEDGLCRCDAGKPVTPERTLFAVVSYSRQNETDSCASHSKSAAIVLTDHRDWICQHAPDLEACKAP